MTKHYLTKDANQTVTAGGTTFRFDPVVFNQATGSMWGTLTLTDPEQIAALESVATANGVSEIDADDYAKFELKKKSPPSEPHIKRFSSPNMSLSSQRRDVSAAAEDSPPEEPPRQVVDEAEAAAILTPRELPPQRETLLEPEKRQPSPAPKRRTRGGKRA